MIFLCFGARAAAIILAFYQFPQISGSNNYFNGRQRGHRNLKRGLHKLRNLEMKMLVKRGALEPCVTI